MKQHLILRSFFPDRLALGFLAAQLFGVAISGAAVEPSRYAGADPTDYIKTMEAKLAAPSRKTDPFGLLQDPDAKPAGPAQPIDVPKVPSIPLENIVGRMQINTIMPAEHQFLIGSRVISQGDMLPVSFNGAVVQIEIVEVNSRRILFRNPQNKDTYARELDLLPPGMTRSSGNDAPPGMVPDSAGTPLQLDPAPAPTNSSKRR
ncbi:hypothetical protein JIN85_09245 [Luteolibacter pohnpeiensis]|uniref:Uncharacterized protein n=1 Tax=Luteolibacter pohnpeiensis TaxID=454153 RepID=A0A934S7A6_9BACT|nr:hypothetical protein [Luteolibacter pohnpeiensis]MBK1882600.1 hypothetical protein [Luteolibacter pohnpeiensis]